MGMQFADAGHSFNLTRAVLLLEYSKPKPSVATISACSEYRMEEIERIADIAGHEAEQAG